MRTSLLLSIKYPFGFVKMTLPYFKECKKHYYLKYILKVY